MADITLKLFASLGDFLPAGAEYNAIQVSLPEGATIGSAIEKFKVPQEKCHLVLLNGAFVPPSQRSSAPLNDGDTVAIWPPVAGG
ncbi:MAG: MoaD/ThiS family protein [Pseudomonadota bacterium]